MYIFSLEHNLFGPTTFKPISNDCKKHQIAVKFLGCIKVSEDIIRLFEMTWKGFIAWTCIIMYVYSTLFRQYAWLVKYFTNTSINVKILA